MAAGTRSLPTDSPIPYSQPIERGYASKGSQEGVYALGVPTPKAGPDLINPMEQMVPTHGEVVLDQKEKIGL